MFQAICSTKEVPLNEKGTKGTKGTEDTRSTDAAHVPTETGQAKASEEEGWEMSECQRHEDILRRVSDLEGTVKELVTKEAFTSLQQAMKDGFREMRDDFKELRDAVEKLKMAPAKRWDALVGDVIKQLLAIGAGLLIAWLTIGGK